MTGDFHAKVLVVILSNAFKLGRKAGGWSWETSVIRSAYLLEKFYLHRYQHLCQADVFLMASLGILEFIVTIIVYIIVSLSS